VALDYEDFSVQLALAIVQPVVAFGLVWMGAHQYAYVSRPLGIALVVGGALVVLAAFFLEIPLLVHLLCIVALWLAISGVFGGVVGHALQERGVVAACTVLDVRTRVETRTSTDADGHNTGTSSTTYYDHELDCGAAPVTKLTSSSALAARGERLDVTYDPEGRMSPWPVADLPSSGSALVLGWIALAATVALRVAAVLFEHPPRRRR
jgi:hypothetical protein